LAQLALREDPDFTCQFYWRADTGEEVVAAAAAADRILYHVTDYEPDDAVKAVIGTAGDRALRLPYIAGNFLWPFATRAHPRNSEAISYFHSSGPYEPQFSDGELIKLMEKHAGEPAEDIVDRFLELDFNAIGPLDRFYEFNRHKYSRLGQSCGLDLWPLVERYLTDHRPFYTCYHPSDLLMKAVGRFALEQLGVRDSQITSVLREFDPFVGGQMPIHPSVIRHFGLCGVDDDSRYVYFPAGHFTAREYYIRFVNFGYDAELHQAVYDFGASGKALEAVPVIADRLAHRPHNPDLWNQFAHVHLQLERPIEAARCAMRAIALEPTRHEFQVTYRHLVDPDRFGVAAWPLLPLGETISLGAEGSPARAGLRAGWSHPEPWGVWGLGGEQRLTYLLDSAMLPQAAQCLLVAFEFWPAIYDADHRLSVDVFVEESLVAQWQFDERNSHAHSVVREIPACPIQRVNGDPVLSLRFLVTGYASPASLGLSKDERNLGLGLKSIAVHPSKPASKDVNDEPILDGEAAPARDGNIVPASGQPELENARRPLHARLRQLWRLGGGSDRSGRAGADRRASLP
jgi:hypothetical protein